MTYLGEIIDYRIALTNAVELRAQTDGRTFYEPGAKVLVRLPPERCHVIAGEG